MCRRMPYVSTLVQHVIGQLDLLKRHGLLGQLVGSERWVRMDVEACRQRRVGFAGNEPRRPVIGVAIPLVVDRNYIHEDRVTSVTLQTRETDAQRREHPPAARTHWLIGVTLRNRLYIYIYIYIYIYGFIESHDSGVVMAQQIYMRKYL